MLTALWLIFTSLVFIAFQPGGRYLILLDAITIGLITYLIRFYICKGMDCRVRSLLSAGGVVVGFGLIRLVFSGIKLTVAGMLLAYLGLVMLELILPSEVQELKSER